jgi:hypothetical protein
MLLQQRAHNTVGSSASASAAEPPPPVADAADADAAAAAAVTDLVAVVPAARSAATLAAGRYDALPREDLLKLLADKDQKITVLRH